MSSKRAERTDELAGESVIRALSTFTPAAIRMRGEDLPAPLAHAQAELRQLRIIVDALADGVCAFDADQQLVVCNRHYRDMHRLSADQTRPGTTWPELVRHLAAAGTSTPPDGHPASERSVAPGTAERCWTMALSDGRAIAVRCQATPDGGWVSTHREIATSEERSTASHERMSLCALIDCVPDYLFVKDRESRFIIANEALAIDAGRANGRDLIGLSDFDFHAADVAQGFRTSELTVLDGGQSMVDQEEHVFDTAGRSKWFLSTKVPMRDQDGQIIGLVGIARDITVRKLLESWRDRQADIIEMIASGAPLEVVLERIIHLVEGQLPRTTAAVWLLDEKAERLRLASGPSLTVTHVEAIAGVEKEPVAVTRTAGVRHGPAIASGTLDSPLWGRVRDLAVSNGTPSCWLTAVVSHCGTVLGALAICAEDVRDPTSTEQNLLDGMTRIAGIAIERKRAEDRIHFMARHDALTRLPNRTLLNECLSSSIQYAQRYDRWVAVVFIDLDDFKIVNDSLGHGAGDQLLQIVAGRLIGCLRPEDTVLRLGGDEFVVILADRPKSADAIYADVLQIKTAIAQPLQLDACDMHVAGSFGIANFPDDGDDPTTLLSHADAAMYRAKENGGDTIQFFTADLSETARKKSFMQDELRRALARSEFSLAYQPQVDLRTGQVFAVEALLRWNNPALGRVGPNEFIPLVEESGQIVQIGDWVLHEACRQNKAWQDEGLPCMTVSVNVSARQFKDKFLTDRVLSALRASALDPRYLELELTESVVMHDVASAVATMERLQAIGVRLAIDDFGTGYSSLSALRTFPVSRLKIDKSFIGDLSTNEDDRAVASAVISLGQKLKLRVIAEGVETAEQVAFLREHNCDEMQGFHFSRPLPSADIRALLQRIGSGDTGPTAAP